VKTQTPATVGERRTEQDGLVGDLRKWCGRERERAWQRWGELKRNGAYPRDLYAGRVEAFTEVLRWVERATSI
jgi:hypothetical protein